MHSSSGRSNAMQYLMPGRFRSTGPEKIEYRPWRSSFRTSTTLSFSSVTSCNPKRFASSSAAGRTLAGTATQIDTGPFQNGCRAAHRMGLSLATVAPLDLLDTFDSARAVMQCPNFADRQETVELLVLLASGGGRVAHREKATADAQEHRRTGRVVGRLTWRPASRVLCQRAGDSEVQWHGYGTFGVPGFGPGEHAGTHRRRTVRWPVLILCPQLGIFAFHALSPLARLPAHLISPARYRGSRPAAIDHSLRSGSVSLALPSPRMSKPCPMACRGSAEIG